ncbi:FAD-binding domain-containing protein [Daldinia caldariorum]|uniref:FAD-binding domain-containing protein n=1 Tax=Daldinia caldariorum TaxID=326644 RepID=UPI002008A582|nr:FAD-binding domain-containing protein [Daldinia caldariorum]KAI1466784.1 FAD-binding domain-containing protein [Daldinia caldariorum]
MDARFDAFCSSLALSAPQVQCLKDEIAESAIGSHSDGSGLEQACRAAEIALGHDRVDTSPLNNTVVHENWSQACVASPYCIIQPANAADVSKALKIFRHFDINFAVRSGGHSPNPGASSIDANGILLDLQHMNAISLSQDKSIASLGPGGRWGDVMETLTPQGVDVVGGRIPVVGVSGLILGGGLHHLMAELGTAADNVDSFEVVLADGTVVNANTKENNDLFWALKGGGPNFGVVTRFDVYTIPARKIWYEIRVYSVDDLATVLDAHVTWQNSGASDIKSTASLIMTPDAITVILQYSAPVERPEAFAPFYNLEPLQIAVPSTIGTFQSLATILGSVSSNQPMRHDYRATSSRIDARLYEDVYRFWQTRALAVRDETGANQTFVIQPVIPNVAKQGVARGGNSMGIPTENHIWWTTLVDWTDPKDDEKVRSVSIETTEQWKKLGQERGLHIPFLYMNDASRDQNPLATYGAENIARLKEISLKYDPTQLFQKRQNGGFLLSRI